MTSFEEQLDELNRPALIPLKADPDAGTVIIAVGEEEARAVAGAAPDGHAVYAIDTPRGYLRDGTPSPELLIVDGKDVIVIPEMDPATSFEAYNAAAGLAEACTLEGAESVRFARKTGIAAVLASRSPDRRSGYLLRLIATAKPKPADTRPKPKQVRPSDAPAAPPAPTGRDTVVVNGDRWNVITDLTAALQRRWRTERLFNYGGIIAQRVGATVQVVNKDAFNAVIAETCATVVETERGGIIHTWPDAQTVGAILSRPEQFPRLDRISQIPFVRADGTICQAPGYDAPSRTYLSISDQLGGIDVPEEPTPGEIKAAVDLLLSHLLEGFPFPAQADKANAVATILTPFVRSLVPISPLAVVDGKEKGSGKNLFADIVSIIVYGRVAEPLPFSIDDDENRKVITSTFRSGATLFVFDEAHKIGGNHVTRALTSHTYRDRILGGNSLAEFPNNVTWLSLGNKVAVYGDMIRRVYRIELAYAGERPEHRPASDFKHPDLRRWAIEHRAELVTACLTLIRAWYVAGQPEPELPFRFGSFEEWQRVIGGILHVAEVDGFLANMKAWRADSDVEQRNWLAHLHWLQATFGAGEFTSGQVVEALRRDRDAEYPHNLPDSGDKSYARALGAEYRRQREVWREGIGLVVAGERKTASKVSVWKVVDKTEWLSGTEGREGPIKPASPTSMRGERGDQGDQSHPTRMRKNVSPSAAPRDTRFARTEPRGNGPPPPPDPPDDDWGPAPTCITCGWPVDTYGHEANCEPPANPRWSA